MPEVGGFRAMKKQLGFSLIEFMIAMAVTLIAVAATMVAFKDATSANQNVTLRADMTDNLRAGLNLIEQDLIQTGTGIPIGGITIPSYNPTAACPNGYSVVNRPLLTGATTFPQCNLALPSIEPGNALGPFITTPDATSLVNSDVITILYADNTLGLDVAPINQPASGGNPGCAGTIGGLGQSVQFDTSCVVIGAGDAQVNSGDLIMFSNANGNAIVQATSVSWPTVNFAKGDAFNLNQTGAPKGTLLQLQNIDAVGNPNGTYPITTATRVWMISYYLDNLADPAHVRLIRRVNFNAGQPVGETLENLQFTYNYNDGKNTNQLSIPAGLSESQIRSVNVFLGVRSVNRWGQTNRYMRNNFQTQISLRSMAYVPNYQ
jgi:prepilin-type N-terminal cleavage/methylation domain-containing protein